MPIPIDYTGINMYMHNRKPHTEITSVKLHV